MSLIKSIEHNLSKWHPDVQTQREFKFQTRETVIAVIRQTPAAFQWASVELKDDAGVVRAAVEKCGRSLMHASREMKNNYDIVMTAVQSKGIALYYASSDLRDDIDIVMAAIRNDGRAFRCASSRLRGTYDVAMAAAQSRPDILAFASPEMRDNEDIMRTAIEYGGGMAINCASDRLRDNSSFIAMAIDDDDRAIQYASPRLQQMFHMY